MVSRMPRYLIWLKQTESMKRNGFLCSLGLIQRIKCNSVLVDISVISSFTCFLIFTPRNFLFASPFSAYKRSLKVWLSICNLDLDSLFTISSLIRSLFFSRNPSAMYSISPGVCLMMKDLRRFTLFDGGKLSCC